MEEIRYWIETEGTGHWFFIAFPVILLCLFIWFRERRVRFLVPTLLISIVIVNPWFYKKWDELGLYAYWRILWVVPVIPIVAGLVPSITERIGKTWIKMVVAAVGTGLIVLGGTFLYNGAGGSFVESANAAKLPDYVVELADRLLELSEHPRIIANPSVSVYLRQYNGVIDSLYGRDIYGYILYPQRAPLVVNSMLNDPEGDLSVVSQMMLDEGYEYLVLTNDREYSNFELVDSVADYGIYKPLGYAKVVEERNDLGQVVERTTIDEYGNPIYGPDGNSTVNYRYNQYNNVVYELRTDIDGNGVINDDGVAGFLREYDSDDHAVREITIGADGLPIDGKMGYAEVRRVFQNDNLISEEYYDTEGRPVKNIAGFASFQTEYDTNGNKICRTYYDEESEQADRIDGYSKADWSKEDVSFCDIDGNILPLEGINLFTTYLSCGNSWSEWMTPTPGMENCTFYIGTINLGENEAGDVYSCQIEIEFRDVECINGKPFLFLTQGAADEKWGVGNVWDYFVYLTEVPTNGVYQYVTTKNIDSNIADAVNFNVGFRCDHWKSGSFRVRKVKIEKNNKPSEWSYGV